VQVQVLDFLAAVGPGVDDMAVTVGDAASHHSPWLSRLAHYDLRPSALSANEYEFWAFPSPCYTDQRQGTQTTAHGATGV
jgi:hypothetical protein